MNATDWATVASLATALGTLILAVEDGWLASQSRHWNVDRPDPRGPR